MRSSVSRVQEVVLSVAAGFSSLGSSGKAWVLQDLDIPAKVNIVTGQEGREGKGLGVGGSFLGG